MYRLLVNYVNISSRNLTTQKRKGGRDLAKYGRDLAGPYIYIFRLYLILENPLPSKLYAIIHMWFSVVLRSKSLCLLWGVTHLRGFISLCRRNCEVRSSVQLELANDHECRITCTSEWQMAYNLGGVTSGPKPSFRDRCVSRLHVVVQYIISHLLPQ